jgi:hypothetical protein
MDSGFRQHRFEPPREKKTDGGADELPLPPAKKVMAG